MKILIIPDVHLKPWMFAAASVILKERKMDKAVSLGDLPDDWGHSHDPAAYRDTFDAAVAFEKEYPHTLWCIGNHDISYLWDYPESGMTSGRTKKAAIEGIVSLWRTIPDENLAFVHRIGDVLFSHGGVSRYYVEEHIPSRFRNDPDKVISMINNMTGPEMWKDISPIWLRPQRQKGSGYHTPMWKPRKFFQVVGHTPVQQITQEGNLLSCDVFSTDRNGIPYGTQEFCLLDTETHEWEGIKAG